MRVKNLIEILSNLDGDEILSMGISESGRVFALSSERDDDDDDLRIVWLQEEGDSSGDINEFIDKSGEEDE